MLIQKLFDHKKTVNYTSTLFLFSLIVVIASEFKLYPFGSELFRFGFGPIAFTFIILITNIKILPFSLFVSTFVLISRIGIDLFWMDSRFLDSLIAHIPASVFYIMLGLCMDRLQIRIFRESPLKLCLFIAIFDFIANMMESLTISILIQNNIISIFDISLIILIALMRSFFVVGVYTSLIFIEHKKKMHQLLSLHSHLYTESLYMKQTMHLIEQSTKEHFLLYQHLKDEKHPLAFETLRLSSDLHEVKKNTQRVVASLSNLIIEDKQSTYTIQQLLQLVKETQKQYAYYLNKDITIKKIGTSYIEVTNYLSLLAILNNIASNAVEAIEHSGFIHIECIDQTNEVIFKVINNGPKVKLDDLQILFEPGYTTKFDTNGNASTGIGLHHVYSLVKNMHGSIHVDSDIFTVFTIQIPKKYL